PKLHGFLCKLGLVADNQRLGLRSIEATVERLIRPQHSNLEAPATRCISSVPVGSNRQPRRPFPSRVVEFSDGKVTSDVMDLCRRFCHPLSVSACGQANKN